MPDNKRDARFPYEHLAVLGIERMKKYVPPARASDSPKGAAQDGPSAEALLDRRP